MNFSMEKASLTFPAQVQYLSMSSLEGSKLILALPLQMAGEKVAERESDSPGERESDFPKVNS